MGVLKRPSIKKGIKPGDGNYNDIECVLGAAPVYSEIFL